jgi:hypothetical protein
VSALKCISTYLTEILYTRLYGLLKQNIGDDKKEKDTVITAASCMKIIANLAGKYQRAYRIYFIRCLYIHTHT